MKWHSIKKVPEENRQLPESLQGYNNCGDKCSGPTRSYFAPVGAAATMELAIEVLPLKLHSLIILKLKIALGIFVTIADIVGDKVGKEESVDTLVLIFGSHGHKHKIDNIILALESLEQMIPSGGKQLSATLLQRPAE